MRIDAHQHFWRYDPELYGWMDERMGVLKRDYLPEDLAPALAAFGMARTVAVQARQDEAETQWLPHEDPSPAKFHDDEARQRLERSRRHLEEVAGQDRGAFVAEERAPRWRRRAEVSDHVFVDRRLRDVVAEVL